MPSKTISKKKKKNTTSNSSKKRPREVVSPAATTVGEISDATLTGAVNALLKRHKAQHSYVGDDESQAIRLVENDDKVFVQVSLVAPPQKPKLLPKRALLPHALYNNNTGEEENISSVCLIVKDPVDEYLSNILQPYIDANTLKVIGLKSLRLEYKTHERRRALAQSHEVFLCDTRITPSIPHLCGTWFTKAKKMPIPIDVSRETQLSNAMKFLYTPIFIPAGNCASIHIGNVQMKAGDIARNFTATQQRIRDIFKDEEIAAVYIRSNSTPALPLFVANPQNIAPDSNSVTDEEDVVEKEMDKIMEEFEKDTAVAEE